MNLSQNPDRCDVDAWFICVASLSPFLLYGNRRKARNICAGARCTCSNGSIDSDHNICRSTDDFSDDERWKKRHKRNTKKVGKSILASVVALFAMNYMHNNGIMCLWLVCARAHIFANTNNAAAVCVGKRQRSSWLWSSSKWYSDDRNEKRKNGKWDEKQRREERKVVLLVFQIVFFFFCWSRSWAEHGFNACVRNN